MTDTADDIPDVVDSYAISSALSAFSFASLILWIAGCLWHVHRELHLRNQWFSPLQPTVGKAPITI
jgi:hypothetical protein